MSELSSHRTWALTDDAGYLLELYEDTDFVDAIEQARRLVGDDVVLDSVFDLPEEPFPAALAANASLPMVTSAFRGAKLPRVTDAEVMRLSVEEAHARLVEYFPTSKPDGRPIKKWQRPEGMVQGLLRQNFKTTMRHPRRRELVSTGLNLAPNALPFQEIGAAAGPSRRLPQGDQNIRRGTFCAGSNAFCRASCLVYTGQNTADAYNNVLKVATSVALISEPVAFMRMLVEAIEWFKKDRYDECNQTACFRLNVYSDIPWELIYPELFERFKRSMFYDYTKVEGRETPRNYDLTFSYSGTNWEQSERELDRGRRLAVVFVSHRAQSYPLPETWKGYDVIDGTKHDFRFLDPGGIIVGLRYKTPNTELLREAPTRMAKALEARNFLVATWVEDGVVVAAETPGASDAFWFDYRRGERLERPR